MKIVMPHEARQVPSWLIFDVSQVMFKKAGRFQTETRARRNLRESEEHKEKREADGAREAHHSKDLRVPLTSSPDAPRIDTIRMQFEKIFEIVDFRSSTGRLAVDHFVREWNAASPESRLLLVHLKAQLLAAGHIVEDSKRLLQIAHHEKG